jgi:DNA-binding CsgD family transcriptional regulator
LLERVPGGWVLRDLGSTNGTYLNGKRVLADTALRAGDEILVGETRLVYRSMGRPRHGESTTMRGLKPPSLTPRERDVLLVLCAKALSGSVFSEPASIREIAQALFVTEAAVKQHLTHLYDKFGVGQGGNRRVRLANEAVRRGAIRLAEVEATREQPKR